jgi:hypothetical protein
MEREGNVAKKTTKAVAAPAKPAITITTCDQADKMGLKLGQARLEREALQNDLDQELTAVHQRYADRLEALATTENELQLALDAFAAKHKKAEDLNYIEIVRAGGGNAVTFKVDEEDVIKRLRKSEVWQSLIKASYSISKRDLTRIPTKLHEKFGFVWGPTKVTFSVKPKLAAVRLYAERQSPKR